LPTAGLDMASFSRTHSLTRQTTAASACAAPRGQALAAAAAFAPATGALAFMEPVKKSRLRKTKMCSFFLAGRCKKQGNCTFAHCVSELQPLPDECYAKICEAPLINGGSEDPACSFAHRIEDIHPNKTKGW